MQLPHLQASGFEGYSTIASLRSSSLADVPKHAGVYLILRQPTHPPSFLKTSPAGWPKGRNPTVDLDKLHSAWVPNQPVLYIGKAGGSMFKSTLHSRLRAYLRHGAGHRSPHWGGRYIWQLADSEELQVAWMTTLPDEPRDVERRLILEFEAQFGMRPFANRVR